MRRFQIIRALLTGFLALTATSLPLSAQTIVLDDLELPDLEGGRWGISVVSLEGTEIVSVSADERFAPASTLKLVTTTAGFKYLGDPDGGKWPQGTSYSFRNTPLSNHPVLVLRGGGDPTLSASPRCTENCLQQIADSVVSSGMTDLASIDVDDSLFEPPHWPPGWSHEDFRFGYATAISALSIDGGIATAKLTPGSRKGAKPVVDWDWVPVFSIDTTEADTVSTRQFDLDLIRRPGARQAFMVGSLPLGSPPVHLQFGLDDPALYAGDVLKAMLEERGVEIHGPVVRSKISYRTKPSDETEVPVADFALPTPGRDAFLEQILHESDNFFAEILVHHISRTRDDRTQTSGLKMMGEMLTNAGVSEQSFNLADGSGLSVYDRMSPNAMTTLLVWAARQDWYSTWSGLLARGGGEGTLKYRFRDLGKAGRLRAKTGSLTGVAALAGYFDTSQGKTYAFTIFVNDTSLSSSQSRHRIDEVLEDIMERLE